MKNLFRIATHLCLFVVFAFTLAVQPVANAATTQQLFPCFTIYAEGSITGIVRNDAGDSLRDVLVLAYKTTGDVQLRATTDAAGEYTITKAPIGSYYLRFKPTRQNAQVGWYDGRDSPLGATAVDVKAGVMTTGIDAMLPTGAQFDVAVRDPDGDPVPATEVSVYDQAGNEVATGITDNAGRLLTTPGLPTGNYSVFASAANRRALLSEYYNHQPTRETATPIVVTQANGKVPLQITLQRGGQISGIVTDAATGLPYKGIYVLAYSANDELEVQTDTDGRYILQGLRSGRYRLRFYIGKPQVDAPIVASRVVSVTAPHMVSGIDVALVQGGAISGRVTAPDGTPIADVWVSATNGPNETTGAATGPDGRYAIYGLDSAQYKIEFYHNQRLAAARANTVAVVAPKTTSGVDAVLRYGGVISGTVTNPDGMPVSDVSVTLINASSGETLYNVARTNLAGEYITPPTLKDGAYFVRVMPPRSSGPCVLAFNYYGNAATTATATRVEVKGSAAVSGIDVALQYGGVLSGQLSDAATGLPLSNGRITIYDTTGAIVLDTYVANLGRYRTPIALPAGNYRVQFGSNGYAPMFYGGALTLDSGAPVPSGAGDINAALSRGGTIRGTITAVDTGAPLEYAEVALYAANGAVIDREWTTIDGTYSFDTMIPSGAYRIGVAPAKTEDGVPYFSGYEVIFSGGARRLAEAQAITLIAPARATVNLAMPPSNAMRPRVFLPVVRH